VVTNLPAEAKAKWAEVAACHSTPQKIKLMREFISLVPKHKGTNKLLGNVRRRIAALERELEKSKARRKGSRGSSFSVAKEGAGQIIILGPTNVGRSSLLGSVTNAKADVTPIPYATRKPAVGMLSYQDVQFQLVEAPALVKGAADGRMDGPQVLGLARNADGLLLMVDLSGDPSAQLQMLRLELEQAGVMIERSEGEVEVERLSSGIGVQVAGGGVLVDCTREDIRRMLESYGISSALVKVQGKVTLDDIENSLFSSITYKPTLVVANKEDTPKAETRLKQLKEATDEVSLPLLPVSCRSNQGLEGLGQLIFEILGIMRVYSKKPSDKEPSPKPIVAEKGAAVIDVAKELHSSLYQSFRYARVWGPSAKYPGQKVGSNHILKDGDTLEIH
jgi:ribosome-interacting GTPase 1